ncbi:MAG: GPR endopeptidase [Clostridia bacterium]|nr:GPR endopeptidase [Clostridia bacterium]MDR3645466.1 GPR endopeptidase [Clostridia bacterium]
MSLIRTDLALEAQEIAAEAGALEGVTSEQSKLGDVTVTKVKVLDSRGEKALGKPMGSYVTVEAPGLGEAEDESYDRALDILAHELEAMLAPLGDGLVLVAGLGNAAMTPDAFGPRCVKSVLVTRHIAGELTKITGLEGLRAVAAIAPGVLGQTGVETGEIIKSLVENIRPAAVIVIDALASRRATRLGNTIQLADTGIIPGSGIGNSRFAINRESLGVPVISVGVPTVVDAATLTVDVLQNAGMPPKPEQEEKIRAAIEPGGISMFVTPRLIDLIVEHAARLTGLAINKALHPGVSVEDMERLVS